MNSHEPSDRSASIAGLPAAGRPVPVLAAAIMAAAAIVVGAMAILPRLAATLPWPAAAQQTLFVGVLYGVLALVGWIGCGMARVERDGGAVGSGTAVGLAVGLGGFVLALGYAGLAGTVERGGGGGTVVLVLLGTLVVAGQSAAEEIFFRGWLQPVLRRGWGVGWAVGVTALAFAALHVAGGARSGPTLLNLFLGGVLFGLLAVRTGGLAAPIAAHGGWNWAEAILFGLDPNPGVGAFGALRDLDLTGAAMWGGSGEGMNASLAMTLVLVALVLPLAVRPDARRVSANRVPG